MALTHAGTKVVADLVRDGNLRDARRHGFLVVVERDDAGVETA